MSVFAYFERRRGELRMPKKTDELGIRWEGPVLSGGKSVEVAIEQDAVRRMEPGGLQYVDPGTVETVRLGEGMDAVLRAHCRLDREG